MLNSHSDVLEHDVPVVILKSWLTYSFQKTSLKTWQLLILVFLARNLTFLRMKVSLKGQPLKKLYVLNLNLGKKSIKN